jgi:hypothetical protein
MLDKDGHSLREYKIMMMMMIIIIIIIIMTIFLEENALKILTCLE